jgi:hypothetical protein
MARVEEAKAPLGFRPQSTRVEVGPGDVPPNRIRVPHRRSCTAKGDNVSRALRLTAVVVGLLALPSPASTQNNLGGTVTLVKVRRTDGGPGAGKVLSIRLAEVTQFFEPGSNPPVPHLRGRVNGGGEDQDAFDAKDEEETEQCAFFSWPSTYRVSGGAIEYDSVGKVPAGESAPQVTLSVIDFSVNLAVAVAKGVTSSDYTEVLGLIVPSPEDLLKSLITWELATLTTLFDVAQSGFDPVNWQPIPERRRRRRTPAH